MSYNLLGFNSMNPGGYDPYGMNMTNSLYMMSFYEQLKNYYAGNAGKTADSTAGSGTANTASADFQTAFQNAFRKALQESMGITDKTAAETGTASGRKSAAAGSSDRAVSARRAYQVMNSFGSHPSHIWTSSFVRS